MLDPGILSLTDLLGSLDSFAVASLVVVALLVLWELAILLGALVGSWKEGDRRTE